MSEWPPLWSSGQSSWQQIQRSGFDSQRYQIFWEVVGLERGALSLLSTIEELLEKKNSGSCQENCGYDRTDLLRWPRGTLCPQKLALTPPKSGGLSVSMVRSWTHSTEFVYVFDDMWVSHKDSSWVGKTDCNELSDHLCGLVVRVLGYRSGGPGSIPGTTRKKKVVGLERGALSLVSTNWGATW
jgi:hypothetical protein